MCSDWIPHNAVGIQRESVCVCVCGEEGGWGEGGGACLRRGRRDKQILELCI